MWRKLLRLVLMFPAWQWGPWCRDWGGVWMVAKVMGLTLGWMQWRSLDNTGWSLAQNQGWSEAFVGALGARRGLGCTRPCLDQLDGDPGNQVLTR